MRHRAQRPALALAAGRQCRIVDIGSSPTKGMGMTLPQFFDVENQMGLSDEQRQLINQWSKLNDRNKRLVCELVEALNEKV